MSIQRRKFLIGGIPAVAGLTSLGRSQPALAFEPTGVLSLYHIHTGEHLSVTYRENGELASVARLALIMT